MEVSEEMFREKQRIDRRTLIDRKFFRDKIDFAERVDGIVWLAILKRQKA